MTLRLWLLLYQGPKPFVFGGAERTTNATREKRHNKRHSHQVDGSAIRYLVELRGVEPLASWMRTKRSPN